MIVQEIIGNKAHTELGQRHVDVLELEWYETSKRIQRKVTKAGVDVAIKLLREGQMMRHNDIIYMDEEKAIIVQVLPCESIIITPLSMLEMGTVCYEIGNKHMPLYIQDDEVLMPFEDPMYKWLLANGYKPKKEVRLLLNLLKSNVGSHGHSSSHESSSLFSKIINLASSVSKDKSNDEK